MLITGRRTGETPLENRLLWWISGWCDLLDGLTLILSLGYICFNLNCKLSAYRMIKRLPRRRINDKTGKI